MSSGKALTDVLALYLLASPAIHIYMLCSHSFSGAVYLRIQSRFHFFLADLLVSFGWVTSLSFTGNFLFAGFALSFCAFNRENVLYIYISEKKGVKYTSVILNRASVIFGVGITAPPSRFCSLLSRRRTRLGSLCAAAVLRPCSSECGRGGLLSESGEVQSKELRFGLHHILLPRLI